MRADEIQPRKLVVFDIDDTLVHTQTRVHVIRDGCVTKSLNSHDFTHYRLQPGEQFDFEDFRNAREFFEKSRPIIPMMNQLKQDINTGNRVVMVTARADFDDRELFLDTFRKYGVDMSRVHVYRAGNMTGATTEEKKKKIIRDLLDRNQYTKAIMYDDAVPNLNSFMELKQEYPDTRFYAWHVDPEGRAREFARESVEFVKEVNDQDELTVSEQIQDYFFSKGYGYVGEGQDQIVFKSPRNTIVKVLGLGNPDREQAVRDYVAFFQANQRNPYYPRIYNSGDFQLGEETYFVYETEYLEYIASEEATLEYIEDLMTAMARGQLGLDAFMTNKPRVAGISEQELAGLINATEDIIDNLVGAKGYQLDLGQIENIRRRANGQLVIVDPVSLY